MTMLILGSILLGLLYAVMAMGVYITFRILDLPDLTVDGCFVLGMAVSALLTVNGHPYYGLLVAIIVGAGAGLLTGILQTKFKMNAILSGILVMTGLYSVNLAIMCGKSNISLAGKQSIFTSMDQWVVSFIYQWKLKMTAGEIPQGQTRESILREVQIMNNQYNISKIIMGILIAILICLALSIFYKTKLGLAIRATGDNEDMVRSSSINADRMKCIGLAMGNGCVALSGALISQYQMFSDVNSGSGMVVTGLASVIIGETLFGKKSVTRGFITAITGSILYRIIIALALKYNVFPAYGLKLVSSIIVAIALGLPTLISYMRARRQRREE